MITVEAHAIHSRVAYTITNTEYHNTTTCSSLMFRTRYIARTCNPRSVSMGMDILHTSIYIHLYIYIDVSRVIRCSSVLQIPIDGVYAYCSYVCTYIYVPV